MDLQLDDRKEFIADEQSYGILEDNTAQSQVKKWSEGSLSGNMHDKTIGLLLYGMFGGYSVSGPTDSAYTHTFTVGQTAQHQSLAFYLHDPLAAQDYNFPNGVVEKLDITIDLKKFITYNAAIKALTGASHADYTPSTTSENRFLPQHFTAKFASAYSTITGGGGTTVSLRSAKISFNGNVEDQEVLGSPAPADFLNKEFAAEGSFEAIWKSESDFKTAFLGPTAQAIRFAITNTDATIGASTNPSLTFDLPSCTFQELSRPFKAKDLTYQTIKFKASYSVTDTLMAKAVLINAISTY
jgi:hypothetical protein